MRIVACMLLILAMPSLVPAQELAKAEFPPGFTVRTDNPAEPLTGIVFVTMSPGWHLTTGPAAILYNRSHTARGEYRVETETFLFDPGRRNEAYGIFFGGRELEGEGQSYAYFMIRRSGEFLVKKRSGDQFTVVTDWTAHPAILKYDEKGEAGTAKNVLAVEVGAERVRFLVNGQEVGSVARSAVDTDGIVGLRVNHSLNLHVTRLDLNHGRAGFEAWLPGNE
jgi:hypothetical protein